MNLGAIVARPLSLASALTADAGSSKLGWIPIVSPPRGISSLRSFLTPPPRAPGRAELDAVAVGAATAGGAWADMPIAAVVASRRARAAATLAARLVGSSGAPGAAADAGGGLTGRPAAGPAEGALPAAGGAWPAARAASFAWISAFLAMIMAIGSIGR